MTAWLVAAPPRSGAAVAEIAAPGTLARVLGEGPGLPLRRSRPCSTGPGCWESAASAGWSRDRGQQPRRPVDRRLACAAMALRARRPAPAGRATGTAAAAVVPAALRLAIRLPCPPALIRLLVRAGDEARIARAGLAGRLSAEEMGRARAGAAVALAAVALPLAAVAPAAAAGAGPRCGGGDGSVAMARGAGAARRRTLVRELPDLLDLLGICVESGMTLDPAPDLAAGRLGGRSARRSRTSSGPLPGDAPRRGLSGSWSSGPAPRARPDRRGPAAG